MSQGNYDGKYTQKKSSPLKPFYPIVGLFIALIAGAIGFFASKPAFDFVRTKVPSLPPQMQWVIAVGIFIVIVLIVGMVFSIFQPRGPKGVNEKDLDKEKQERAKELIAATKRKREMQAKMRARNRTDK